MTLTHSHTIIWLHYHLAVGSCIRLAAMYDYIWSDVVKVAEKPTSKGIATYSKIYFK